MPQVKNQEKFFQRFLKGLVWWLIGAVICVLYSFFMTGLMQKFMAMKILTGVCALIIVNGLYCNFIYNCAADDRKLNKLHHVNVDRRLGIKLAFSVPVIQYLSWIALAFSKIGIIGDFFSPYIFINMYTLGWIDLFTEGRTIDSLSWLGLFGLLLLAFISSAVILLTYELTYREIDVKQLLFYGKNKR